MALTLEPGDRCLVSSGLVSYYRQLDWEPGTVIDTREAGVGTRRARYASIMLDTGILVCPRIRPKFIRKGG